MTTPESFRDNYEHLVSTVREGKRTVSEMIVQSIWFEQLFRADSLVTSEGQPIAIVSQGWWNRAEGPDFKGAQIRFGDTVRTGDIEIHLDHAAWRQHGHHLDSRYDNVILVVVLDAKNPASLPVTSRDRPVPCLLLGNYVDAAVYSLPDLVDAGEYAIEPDFNRGFCAVISEHGSVKKVMEFAHLAGENRLLSKARIIRERADRVGIDQAVYEGVLAACGYSRYKHHFRLLAQQLPYDRVAQLARIDPFLVEAAFLQLAGLLPASWAGPSSPPPHYTRIVALRDTHLPGMRALPLAWKRAGVRPNNYPERRLSGAARLLARACQSGLWQSIESIWHEDATPLARRRGLEGLFPRAMGFWAEHCTWQGERLRAPVSPLGAGRAHAIIGNVFLPATLAMARQTRNRQLEERVFKLFIALPKEPENHIVKIMLSRVFGNLPPKRVDFRLQQGLLQIYQDWCEPNPSCRDCPAIAFLDPECKVPRDTGLHREQLTVPQP